MKDSWAGNDSWEPGKCKSLFAASGVTACERTTREGSEGCHRK